VNNGVQKEMRQGSAEEEQLIRKHHGHCNTRQRSTETLCNRLQHIATPNKILEPPIHLDPATHYFTPSIEPRGIQNLLEATEGQSHILGHEKIESCTQPRMMMIAFITIKSSLVPLIEGLCAQIYFRFETLVVCSHLLIFFFVKEKTC